MVLGRVLCFIWKIILAGIWYINDISSIVSMSICYSFVFHERSVKQLWGSRKYQMLKKLFVPSSSQPLPTVGLSELNESRVGIHPIEHCMAWDSLENCKWLSGFLEQTTSFEIILETCFLAISSNTSDTSCLIFLISYHSAVLRMFLPFLRASPEPSSQ